VKKQVKRTRVFFMSWIRNSPDGGIFLVSNNDDLTLFQVMKDAMYSAVLSDALDHFQQYDQAMHANIRPLYPEAVVVGRAVTVQSIDVYERTENTEVNV
jgi:hypothetical protein